jgi:hypothetical protein
MEEKEELTSFDDLLVRLEEERKERMRPFRQLTFRKKLTRIRHDIQDFFRYRIWGRYHGGGLVGAYHWVRCHTWNRYHIIDLRGHGDYKWGWIDRDHAMWIACFSLLVDYVEKEEPFKYIDWDWNDEHQAVAREIKEIYDWWKSGRKKDHEDLAAIDTEGYRGPGWQEYCRRSEELDQKDDEMFDRLMKVRKYLWT